MNIQDDIIEKTYNEIEFKELRDRLAMKLYEFLFLWLVEQMNIFYKTVETTNLLKIGILDIFGFENLKKK
jgi:myosin heavy subunit